MFGKIQLEQFAALTKMPQKAASAWSAVETSGLVGASFKPVLYVGEQVVNGVNYYFIAEETIVLRNPIRHLVLVAINEVDGKYKMLDTITEIV